MRMVVVTMIAALAAANSDAASAQENPVKLKPGAGLEEVEGNCAACHSLDYIPMNSPFMDAAGWTAEVNRMIKAFGAHIGEADAKAIIEYLTTHYGS